MKRPVAWRFIERRLRRALPETAASTALGDLFEDYQTTCEQSGRVRAELDLWREVRSLRRAYGTHNGREAARLAPAKASWNFSDFRSGLRMIHREPGLALAIVFPVALAVATSAALFSIVDGLLFRPLPFKDVDRLVGIQWKAPGSTPPNAEEQMRTAREVGTDPSLLTAVRVFSDNPFGASDVAADLGLSTSAVGPQFFTLLGVTPALGRDFSANDDVVGGPLVVILGHDMWMRAFGGDKSVVDRSVTLAGRSLRVIGVMPPGIDYPAGTNVWMPFERSMGNMLQLSRLGRLAPGATAEQVAARYPGIEAVPLRKAVQPAGTETLIFVLCATVLFLLVAWVQVGALVLARAVTRTRECGVRLALGASRARLARQFATEGAVLAAIALLAAWLLTPVLVTWISAQLPVAMTQGQRLAPDVRTFAFSALVSIIGIVVLTLAPVGLLRSLSPLTLIRDTTSVLRVRTGRARSLLVVGQMALTTLLLSLAGLALHSFVRVASFDVGFDAGQVWRFSPPSAPKAASREAEDSTTAARDQRVRDTVSTLEQLPGAIAASAVMLPPFQGGLYGNLVSVDEPGDKGQRVGANFVMPGFFTTVGTRLLEGRTFDDADLRAATDAAVVNQTLARRLSASGPVVGRRITVMAFSGRIVGVVGDVLDTAPGQSVSPTIFLPTKDRTNVVLVRVDGTAEAMRAELTSTLERLWGPFAPRRLTRVSDAYARVIAPWRARSVLLGSVALLCLPLAVIGIAGATAYRVRARTREIAIRVALGADQAAVGRTVMGRALVLVGTGVAIGLAGGVGVARLVQRQLFQIQPLDWPTLIGVSAGMVTVALLASYGPARRAARIAPAIILKDS